MERTQSTTAGRNPLGEIVLDGIMAGVIGASTIALFCLLVDLTRFEGLFTPSLLGSAVFAGEVPSTTHAVNHGMVAVYSVLHGAIFLGLGMIGAFILGRRGTSPGLMPVGLAIFAVLEFGSIAAAAVWRPEILQVLGAVTITVGNLLAGLAMGAYLHGWQPHRGSLPLPPAGQH